MGSHRLTDAEIDAALEHMQALLSVRGTAIVAELRERRAAERQPPADLSTAEHNARTALARDPLECVAITAEAACALFDQVRELEAERDRAEIHAARAEKVAAARRDSGAADKELIESLRVERDDARRDAGFQRALLAEAKNEATRVRVEAMQEIEMVKRDRDERLAACVRGEQHERERNADLVQLLAATEAQRDAAEGALADANKRLDILRAAYEAETGRTCRL